MLKTRLKCPLTWNHQNSRFFFSSKAKYQIPNLQEYNQLFEESNIIEKIMPRKIVEG